MGNKSYELQYFPLFEENLMQICTYIEELHNSDASKILIDEIEEAILKRLQNSTVF